MVFETIVTTSAKALYLQSMPTCLLKNTALAVAKSSLDLRVLDTQDLYCYLEAVIMKQTSMEEAIWKLDELAGRHTETLRLLTKKIQDARIARDNEGIKTAIMGYDEALETYIPGIEARHT